MMRLDVILYRSSGSSRQCLCLSRFLWSDRPGDILGFQLGVTSAVFARDGTPNGLARLCNIIHQPPQLRISHRLNLRLALLVVVRRVASNGAADLLPVELVAGCGEALEGLTVRAAGGDCAHEPALTHTVTTLIRHRHADDIYYIDAQPLEFAHHRQGSRETGRAQSDEDSVCPIIGSALHYPLHPLFA